MGRPLNKKYFGNRNIGTTTTTDNGIGGEGVASVTIGGTNNAYVAVPTVTFADPTLPGGVTATGSAVMGVVGVTLVAAGTGYAVNDVITLAAGAGAGTAATLTVTAITGGGATGPIDTVSITTAGNYTTITDVTAVGVTGPGNDDATFDLTFKVNSITVTEKGSGYVSAPAITMTGNATKTAVLTTDSGSAGSSTNQENAIVCTAFIPAANGGTQALTGDIVKQTNDRRYKVKTSEGTGICQLVTDGVANAAGEISIKATDSEGKNYLVAKLTSRKVVLVPAALGGQAGTQFASGTSAKWTFGAAVLNTTVTIENA
jgi:hypothetical protein